MKHRPPGRDIAPVTSIWQRSKLTSNWRLRTAIISSPARPLVVVCSRLYSSRREVDGLWRDGTGGRKGKRRIVGVARASENLSPVKERIYLVKPSSILPPFTTSKYPYIKEKSS